jgi:hypothetical protein
MDDPIFDPWGADTSGAGASAPAPSRWRSRGGIPSLPLASDTREPGRLPGTRGYLRTMASPRLGSLIARLQLAQHDAALEDALEGSPPLIRITFRPRRGPFTQAPPSPFATLEFEIQEGEEEVIVARWWVEPTVKPTAESTVAPSGASGAWLERVCLAFVEQVFDRTR